MSGDCPSMDEICTESFIFNSVFECCNHILFTFYAGTAAIVVLVICVLLLLVVACCLGCKVKTLKRRCKRQLDITSTERMDKNASYNLLEITGSTSGTETKQTTLTYEAVSIVDNAAEELVDSSNKGKSTSESDSSRHQISTVSGGDLPSDPLHNDPAKKAASCKEELGATDHQESNQKLTKDEGFKRAAAVLPPTPEPPNATAISKEPQPLLDDYSTIGDIIAASTLSTNIPSDGESIPMNGIKSPTRAAVSNDKEEVGKPYLFLAENETEEEDKEESCEGHPGKKKDIPLYSVVNLEMKSSALKREEEKSIPNPTSTVAAEDDLLDNVIEDITKWALELSPGRSPSPPPLPPPPMSLSPPSIQIEWNIPGDETLK